MGDNDNILKTPIGRFVGGSFTTYKTKDYNGNDVDKKYLLAMIAFDKNNILVQQMYYKIKKIAKHGFPNIFKNDENPLNFSWKITDGDSTTPNNKGIKPCEKQGYKGNFVFKFKTYYPLKIYDRDEREIIDDGQFIKLGDYVRIIGSVVPNNQINNPGIYLNMNKVQHVAFGPPIISYNDEKFDEKLDNLPNDASMTPYEIDKNINIQVDNDSIPMPPNNPDIHPAVDILDTKETKKYNLDGKIWIEDDLKRAGWSDEQLSRLQQIK